MAQQFRLRPANPGVQNARLRPLGKRASGGLVLSDNTRWRLPLKIGPKLRPRRRAKRPHTHADGGGD